MIRVSERQSKSVQSVPVASRPKTRAKNHAPLAVKGSAAGEFAPIKRVVAAQVQSEKLVLDRRERIIRAAITVFQRQGFHTTTTADIAHEAGLTQSNLYNYVKSKQDVLFLVCEHLVGTYDALLDEAQERYEDPYTRLVEALKSVTGVMSTYRDEVQLLYNETHALEKRDRVVILSSISRFIGRFETLVENYEREKGQIKLKDPRLAANCLSFVPAMIALRYWDLVLHNSERGQDQIIRFILRGLGIPEPTPE